MSRQLLFALFATAAFTPTVQAQRFLLTEDHPASVRLVDANAGCLFEQAHFDLSVTTTPAVGLRDAQRVGSEVWVSSARAIHRFDAFTQSAISLDF